MTTISASTTIGITLGSPSFVNPIVVNSGVTISNTGAALYAPAGYWTIQNDGTISSYDVFAVLLKAGGVVTNAASGLITGADGIVVEAGAGTVVNSGTIAAGGNGHGGRPLNDGTGVYIEGGGSVTNAAFASIAGYYGIAIVEGTGTVVNSGSIGGGFAGVFLDGGGAVTNAVSASIAGVLVEHGTGTVVNSGGIAANREDAGVFLESGGLVSNSASGSIAGYIVGVRVAQGAGTVINSGTIRGTGAQGNGVILDAGGSVTNAASASIAGLIGVYMESGGTVTNAGTITGSKGRAVAFLGAASGQVVVDPGAVFSGSVVGGAGSNVLELASGGSTGTLADIGTSFANFGTVTVDSGASWKLTGTNTIPAGGTLTNAGSISGGITLGSGAIATDASGGTIHNGGTAAIYGAGGAVTVVNSGSIAGVGYYGIFLRSGGAVTNAASASIAGGRDGIMVHGGAGTIVNSGSVTAALYGGVALFADGTITNAASASIMGGKYGVGAFDGPGTVVNSGSIGGTAPFGYGVILLSGGMITNAAAASIAGYIAISLLSGGTVTNAGTIAGSGGVAINVFGSASDRVVVDPGAVFIGTVSGSTSASNALELASGGSAGTLAGLGTTFVNFGTVTVDSGASWELTRTNTVAAGATLANSGTLTLSGATFTDSGGLVNDGGLVLDPSTLTVANLSGSGSVTISSGSVLDVLGGIARNVAVASGGTLMVSSGGAASGVTVMSGGIVEVFDGGSLIGSIVDNGTLAFDITIGLGFSGTVTGNGLLVVSGGGDLKVTLPYSGAVQVDDTSTLGFDNTYVGVATFNGSSTGPGGTLKLDAGSTGPITVVNSNDTVVAQPGGNSWINAAVSYTLPANIDALFLFAGAHGTGNSDAAGDALYALDTSHTQTLTGNSPNDAFVVYNSSDVVVPKAGSHDVVYAAASYTVPSGVDVLFLEGTAAQGTGNSDAAGDALYAANPGQVATLTGNSANDVFVVYNSADVVVPKAGSHDVVYSAVNYTLPTGVDVLYLEAGTQGVGNSDASGDALYAADAGIAQTLTGNSANDIFVVYNSSDVVAPKAGSHDVVYSAVNYTLPTGVDVLYLEAGTQGVGNSDAAGDVLYAADAGIAQTLTGHSHNDSFVIYNSADVVIGQAGSTDKVYAAANFTLPTNVDALFLEGNASHGAGNSDAVDALFGNSGVASTLVAGSGADTLYVTGTAGTIMTGGTGHDTFAFPNVMGHDEVTNFGIAKDTLQFNATLFSNFTAAMNHASQSGANTVFTIDANDTVTLDNLTKTSLTAGNFHFS